jgi:hypothetical protein
MRTLTRIAAKLYPRSWRDRYGEEFDALLDDSEPDGHVAWNVLIGAVAMQINHWHRAVIAATFVVTALLAMSWWAGQHPYVSPGTHRVFHMDSTPGALLAFLVILATCITGIMAFARMPGAARVCLAIVASYFGALASVSLVTPQKIVSIGDSYCWDLWCVGIQKVNMAPQGQDVLYTAEVSVSVDSVSLPPKPEASAANSFFYAFDERGRRYPVTAIPGKSSLTFVAPANARELYLSGDITAPPWVRLYFGSDLNPFHRRTLLRIA